jgi:NADPH2:quinone reductase
VAPAAIVARKPKNLAGGTAWDAMVRRLKVHLGETVLIHGDAGGVGSFAVQIGKAVGARVLATASSANQQALRDLRADVPIDYTKEDASEVALHVTDGKGVGRRV